MNRFKSLFGLVLGLMLAASLLGPTALAQPPEPVDTGNVTTVSVTITETGVFDAYFCQVYGTASSGIDLTLNQAPTLGAPGLATGSLFICYTDTLAYRPSFDAQINAGAFTGGPSIIPLSGFKIDRTYNVIQQYWGSNPDYGDIGSFVNNAYQSQADPWPKAWTTNNTLDTTRTVQFGYSGIGTATSYGQFDVSLVLPIGTQGGQYTSTLTLSIVAGTQP
jgi:hypothetical protein